MYNSDFYSGYKLNPSVLNLDLPERGKRLFIWKYQALGSSESLAVEVSLRRSKTGAPVFSALHVRLGEVIEGTDLEKLAKAVQAKLDGKAHELSGLVWENWLKITVKGGDSMFDSSKFAGMGANLHIQVTPLKRAIHPVHKTPVTINDNNCVVELEPPTKLGTLDHQEFLTRDSPSETSYVPDTPENRAALEVIATKMRELRAMLAERFSQEKAEASLKQIDNQFLLNPPT